MAEKLAPVGWQGITLKAPGDWSLVGVSGDDKKGYFRVDSPVATAVEVRWSQALGKAPNLMAKGREFLSNIKKSSRKSKIQFESKINPDDESGHSVSFSWSADRLGSGRLIYCASCDRVIIAQVVSAKDDEDSRLAKIILDSLSDHRDDGWVNWALYGLSFAVPGGYKIDKQKLMSGYLSLSFKSKAKTIVVERWGLAKSLTSSDSLEEWFRKDVLPDVQGYKVEVAEYGHGGHSGLKMTGRRAGIKQAYKAAAFSLTLYQHPGVITGYAWYCVDSNRLFCVRATHVKGDDIAEKIRDSIECH